MNLPKIKPLSKKLISKIAAGEVVERPSSVVKELLENSIDAHATYIKIEIEEAGLKLIKLTDNGHGMPSEDLLECFKLHTTSKLSTVEGLYSIITKGFRGEALASIASVSNLIIKSRTKDNISGYLVEVADGDLIKNAVVGMPIGTTIIVRDLFNAVPARKKFLKTNKTEFRKILETVIKTSIAHPKIGFFLAHNKKIVLDLPEQQSVSERIRLLLGKEIAQNLIPIEVEKDRFRISGYVTRPQISHSNKSKQHIFVNQRPISNSLISSAVKDAFGSFLMPKNHPIFTLFFELPPSMVDVNVHPRKEEVAFTSSENIYELFKDAISNILLQEDLGYKKSAPIDDDIEYEIADFENAFFAEDTPEYIAKDFNAEEDFILQIHKLFLVKQTKKGVLLIDQHAAHERILYERFLNDFKENAKGKSKNLAKPYIFELSLAESDALFEYLEVFRKMGFEIDEFGNNSFKIGAVPIYVSTESPDDLIKEVLADLLEGKSPKDIDEKTNRALSYMSCRSAIMAGDYLSQEERKELLKDLENTKTAYTCPHGRPVKIELSMSELARMFKRK